MSYAKKHLPAPSVRNQTLHVAAVLGFAILVRVALYDQIAIRGDLGYWLLDGQWTAQGRRPFFDFIGRSPAFLYLSAGAIRLFGVSLAVFRWFVASLWLSSGLVFYATAREVGSHRAGLITLAVATLTPFPLAYTFFSSSQSLGVLAVGIGVFALAKSQSVRTYALAGGLVGLAYLSRRAMVLALPALAIYLLVRWYRRQANFRDVIVRGVSTGIAFLAVICTGYLALALGNIENAWKLFIIHFVNLFISSGAGGVPLLEMADAVASGDTATSSSGMIDTLLDNRSGAAMVATVIGGATLMVPLVDYAKAASDVWLRDLDRLMIYTMVGMLAPMLAIQAALGSLYYRVLWIVALAVLLAAIHSRDRLQSETLLSAALLIPTLICFFLAIGYILRPNLLASYYAMDGILFLAVPLGVAVDHWWPSLTKHRQTAAVVCFVLLVVFGTVPLAPITPSVSINADGRHDRVSFFTVDNVKELNKDIERRAGEDGVILTSQPNYVALNDVRVFEDNNRAVYLRHLFGDSGPQKAYYGRLNDAMRSGDVELVVHERFNKRLLETNATVNQTLYQCYEPADNGAQYRSLNTIIYEYDGCRR